MSNIILGIDPGYNRMGFGVLQIEGREMNAIDYGVMKTPGGLRIEERLLHLAEDLQTIINEHPPQLMAVEKIFLTNNQKTVMQVAETRGVILLMAAQNGIPVVEFTPSQIKLAMTGNGRATKVAMQRMVKTVLGLQRIPKPDDAADALAVAVTAANKFV